MIEAVEEVPSSLSTVLRLTLVFCVVLLVSGMRLGKRAAPVRLPAT